MVIVEHGTTRILARAAILTANVIGGGSLLAFGVFLLLGPEHFVDLARNDTEAVGIDAILSIAFFIQHSWMVRRSFRKRLAACVPRHYHGAIYAISSGLVLTTLVVLWQPATWTLVSVGPPARWLFRAAFGVSVVSFVWGIRALGSFDGLGVRPIRAHLRGEPLRELPLTIRGPYRWVRHPLYTMVLVLIWSNPDLSADRLMFNILWTVWIVVGTILEERDLVEDFGDDYRRYQRNVPMLIPWRPPSRTIKAPDRFNQKS
jgi:protein-S-isoprenylcysteine O-methyltransferase Ste14